MAGYRKEGSDVNTICILIISRYVNPLKKCYPLFVALRSHEEERYEPAHPASRKNYIELN